MKHLKKNILNYSLLFILTLIFLQLFLKISDIDLYNPIAEQEGSDRNLVYAIVKSFLVDGTPIFGIPNSIHIGAPGTFSMGDFPVFDWNLMIIIMKGIYFFVKNVSCTIYVYYFLTFFAIAFASFYVFKKFRINTPIAITSSLLFVFTPYHILRNVWHLTYSSYYLIPFMMIVVFWLWSKKPLFFKYSNNKWSLDLCNKKSIIALCTVILSGIFNIYFDFFWMFFLTVAVISTWYYRKNIYNIYSYIILVLSNLFVVAANAFPYLIYKLQYGYNYEALSRSCQETEIYGLKIIQMVLPVDDHFLFADWKTNYNLGAILVNENTTATLGIIALIGFLFVLFYFLFVRNKKFDLFNKCGLLIISGLLLANIGSFSSVISFMFLKEIRCYNRISIFISFIAILVFALLIKKLFKHIKSKYITIALLVIITVVGLRDEIPISAVYSKEISQQNFDAYKQLKEFMFKVENVNQENAMIFQLPYVPFPENAPVVNMLDYEQFKPHFVSNKLRFSYGAMKGREAAKWNKKISEMEIPIMINHLREKGFSGILISKKGYEIKERYYMIKTFDKYLKYKIENDEYIYYSL